MDIIGNIFGGMMGYGASTYNNQQAAEREAQARAENYRYGEMAAENADARTRALYNDLQSPEALRRQFEAAGLSPSLMFGGQGAGAQPSSGAIGQGATGVSPTTYGLNIGEASNVAVQQAMARKLNAEADEKEGKTPEAMARIENIVASTGNTIMQTEYTALKNEWQQFENAIKGATAENEIAISEEQLKQSYETTNQFIETTKKLKADAKISEETANDIIQQVRDATVKQQAEIYLLKAQEQLAKSGVTLNKAQAQKLLNDIIVDNENIKLRGQEIEISKQELQARVDQWAIENKFKAKDQKIAIAQTVAQFLIGGAVATGSVIKAVTPLGAVTKVAGLAMR